MCIGEHAVRECGNAKYTCMKLILVCLVIIWVKTVLTPITTFTCFNRTTLYVQIGHVKNQFKTFYDHLCNTSDEDKVSIITHV